ncbi:MAG: hypothetical protein ABS95_02355 [Verrucomicrobia bacterium SCN 57-15]|nr:MAG: hypothetical protein ABS95_02355 [Verrucomicrobia bacterium SCN 57-15]
MKNPNAIRPRAQELNESVRRPEDILELKIERLMVEPKFDGCFIYITRDRVERRPVLCTKDGNELHLDPAVQNFVLRHFERLTEYFLFEAELEPDPWSEANKVTLNGNLYSGRQMPFAIRLVVHDVLPVDEVEKATSTARQRYALLRALAGAEEGMQLDRPLLWHRSEKDRISITPCQEVTRDAAAELFRRGWEQGKARKRVMVAGLPYEGLVLIDPESLHKDGRSSKWKVKPFHTVDIRVTELREGHSGKVPLYEVHGCDVKTGESAKITSGISSDLFARLKQTQEQYPTLVIEVEVSSLRELQSANPTIQSIRFDKMGSPKRELEVVVAAV